MDVMSLLAGQGQAPQGGAPGSAAYTTPQQITSLYEYANALGQPVPVNQNGKMSWTQGLADVLRSGIGGYLSHEADLRQQQGLAAGAAQSTPLIAALLGMGGQQQGGQAPTPGGGAPANGPTPTDPLSAASASIAKLESGGNYGAIGPATSSGDHAYGKYQVMGANIPSWTQSALGQAMTPEQFLNNPQAQEATFKHQFGSYLDKTGNVADAASMWFTGRPLSQGANASDVNGMTGARYAQMVAAGQPQQQGAPEQTGAISAPSGNGAPGGIGGLNPQNIAAVLSNPMVPDSTKAMVVSLLKPQVISDAIGGHYLYSPAMGTPQPIVSGIHISEGPAHVPIAVTGNPGNPQTTILAPGTNGMTPQNAGAPGSVVPPPGGGANPAATGPLAPYMPLITAGQNVDAQGRAKGAIAGQQADEYTQATHQAEAARNAAYPLRQIQGILEKTGGELPTGQGADKLISAESLGNLVSTALGHPLTSEDSQLTALQLLHKYGVQIATAQAQNVNVSPTNLGLNLAGQTSPGTELSGPANLHLVDNLVRLNDLNQKYFQAKQSYYQQNGNLDNFQKTWQQSIDGGKAVPLSRFPIATRTGSDGKLYDKVPSTDHRGFSWVVHGTVQ
jgi:hypothetical protein